MQTSNTIMVVAFDSSLGCTTNCTTHVKKLYRRKKWYFVKVAVSFTFGTNTRY